MTTLGKILGFIFLCLIAFIVWLIPACCAGGAEQAPCPPQAPPLKKAKKAKKARKPAPKRARKTCPCSAACTCGCNEGEPCRCGTTTISAPARAARSGPAPVYYRPPVRYYQPAYRAPMMMRGGGGGGGC